MSGTDFSRWREVLSRAAEPVLRAALPGARDGASIALAAPAALLLLGDDPALHPALAEGFRMLAGMGGAAEARHVQPLLKEPGGHSRDIYHALALHMHIAAFAKRYESLPPGVWSVCEDALPGALLPVRAVERYADVAPPPGRTGVTLWQALCVLEQAVAVSRDVDVELVDGVVHPIVSRPGPDGALHPRGEDESLDAWTYRELSGLHALANLALLRRNKTWAGHVERIAMHHVENTQPDNTTNQPWAWFAFFWSPKTRSFAEQQLHDATANGLSVVAAILLADAANALAQFDR
ncbi:MAG: hypothetical protein K8S99_00200 [Planctomycetes bacterium]|nr:hypothetical protein [Planctomycetota bacterium]